MFYGSVLAEHVLLNYLKITDFTDLRSELILLGALLRKGDSPLTSETQDRTINCTLLVLLTFNKSLCLIRSLTNVIRLTSINQRPQTMLGTKMSGLLIGDEGSFTNSMQYGSVNKRY